MRKSLSGAYVAKIHSRLVPSKINTLKHKTWVHAAAESSVPPGYLSAK